jgi:diadenylate cyclase
LDFFTNIDLKITDLIDIVLVALLLYYVYKLVRGSVAINIFIGIVIVWGFWKLTDLLGMNMISSIVGPFLQVGLVALIVVFQQEIRKFLLMIGSTNFSNKRNFLKHFKFLRQENLSASINIEAILNACENMSTTLTGALFVIERSHSLDFIKSSGDKMYIEITQPIIESIFYKNSPLHFGLRHRAAVGITEKTDALALVVSEETGSISYLRNGEFVHFKDLQELSTLLKDDLT